MEYTILQNTKPAQLYHPSQHNNNNNTINKNRLENLPNDRK